MRFLALFAALLLIEGAQGRMQDPSRVPVDLRLTDMAGDTQSLSRYRGKVVVLNFWATWCVPCREEMPLLVDAQKRYASEGVVVIGASADDESTQEEIQPFIRKHRITFPIWTGATTEHMKAFGVGEALPATVIIDRDGAIAFRILGIVERRELTRSLDYLLSAREGTEPETLIDTLTKAQHNHKHEDGEHGEDEEHTHGGVAMEGASMVPS